MFCYFATDDLALAVRFCSRAAAVDNYRALLADHLRYGEPHNAPQASLHFAATRAEINEYPDYVLSCGPRGGVRIERT